MHLKRKREPIADAIFHSANHYPLVMEKPKADESQIIIGLNEQFHLIQEQTAKNYGSAVRNFHAKAHALVKGRIEVLDGLGTTSSVPFCLGGAYDVLMRVSTLPSDILDDSIGVPGGGRYQPVQCFRRSSITLR